jgi:hypothetical protein
MLGEGKGRSKREAEQDAARHAIDKLGPIDNVSPRKKSKRQKKKKLSAKKDLETTKAKDGTIETESKINRGIS